MSFPADPYNFTNGTTADGEQVDARFAALYAALSAGGLDPGVFAAGVIGAAKLASDTRPQVSSAVQSGGAYTLTTSFADLPGASIAFTPPVASWALILAVANFRFSLGATAVGSGYSYIDLDGSPVGFSGRTTFGQTGGVPVAFEGAAFAFAIAPVTLAAHTVKLKVRAGSTLGFVDPSSLGGPASGIYCVTLPS